MYKIIKYTVFLISLMEYSFTWKIEDFGKEFVELMTSLHNTCINRTGTDNAAIESIKNGKFIEDDKIKKYITCLWQESTVVESDGTMNTDILMNLCPPNLKETIPKLILDCWKEANGVADLVDKIYEMEKCLYKTSPEVRILLCFNQRHTVSMTSEMEQWFRIKIQPSYYNNLCNTLNVLTECVNNE